MRKRTLIILFVVVVLCFSCSSNQIAGIQALLPDLSGRADGIYSGQYNLSGTPVRVAVDVTVRNQNIAEVKITRHTGSPIGRRAEVITERIIESQSLNVDIVSGATGSSKAILKAVENALQ
jgi:uncharacterized protein with FMN-binding domain